VKQYLRLGKHIADRNKKRYNKSGISSWDNNNEFDPDDVTEEQEVETGDLDDGGNSMFEDAEAALNADGDQSPTTASFTSKPKKSKVSNKGIQTDENVLVFPSDSIWLHNAYQQQQQQQQQQHQREPGQLTADLRASFGAPMLHPLSANMSPIPPGYVSSHQVKPKGARLAASLDSLNNSSSARKSNSNPSSLAVSPSQTPQQHQQRTTYQRPFKFIDINKWDSNQSVFSQESSSLLSHSLDRGNAIPKYHNQGNNMNDLQSLASLTTVSGSIGGVHSLPTYIFGTNMLAASSASISSPPHQHSLDGNSSFLQAPHTVTGGAPSSSYPYSSNNKKGASAHRRIKKKGGGGFINGDLHDDSTISLDSQLQELSISASSLTNRGKKQPQEGTAGRREEDEHQDEEDEQFNDSAQVSPKVPLNYHQLASHSTSRGKSQQQIIDERDDESISFQDSSIVTNDNISNLSNIPVGSFRSFNAIKPTDTVNDNATIDSGSIAMTLSSNNSNSVNRPVPTYTINTDILKKGYQYNSTGKGGVALGNNKGGMKGSSNQQQQQHLLPTTRVKYSFDHHTPKQPISFSNKSLGISPNNTSSVVSQLIMSSLVPTTTHPVSHPSTTPSMLSSPQQQESSGLKDSVDNMLEMNIAGKRYAGIK
jgi:hypothetical protein